MARSCQHNCMVRLSANKNHAAPNVKGVFVCKKLVYFGIHLSLLWSVWREVPRRKGDRKKIEESETEER